jgi:glutathione S-transferase
VTAREERSIRLYSRDGAGRPPRVRWALEEAGAPYEVVVLSPDEAAGEEHRRRQPLGRVPALEIDGDVLFESAALCLQIADLFPEADLIPPPGSPERGAVYQWTIFAMSELEPAMIAARRAQRADDAAELEAARARLAAAVEALERALEGDGYLVGDRFTVADVVVGGILHSARQIEVLPESPRVAAYLGRLDARPAKQAAYPRPA